MSEAIQITDKVRVTTIDRKNEKVKLFFLTGVDKDQVQEYSISGAEIDAGIQNGDVPIDATTKGGTLISLAFPPDAKPQGPSKAEIHEQFVQEAKAAKVLQWQIASIDGTKIVLTKGGIDAQYNLIENASKFHKSFHQGDLVQFIKSDEKTIKTLWKVDENGKRPEKNGYGQQSVNIDVSPIAGAILAVGSMQIDLLDIPKEERERKKGELAADAITFAKLFQDQMTKEVKN